MLNWFIVNIGILSMFIYGYTENMPWILNISLIIYWFTAIVGTLIILIPTSKLALINIHSNTPRSLDISYDIVVMLFMVSFGFYWLSIFYVLHIYGLDRYFKARKLE